MKQQEPPAPVRSLTVSRDHGHVLHVESHGNQAGIPTVILHGGPGAGISYRQLQTVDLARHQVILFDQRGSGKSTPTASLEANTTAHLVGDLEAIREQFGFEKWIVAGGSWGSTLALAYAQKHPDRVAALRLYGIFLASREEVDWWFQGISTAYPDYWEDFAAHVTPAERGDLCAAYHQRLTSNDNETSMSASYALRLFSARTQTLEPSETHVHDVLAAPEKVLAVARLFTHYCRNRAFMRSGELLQGIDRIRHIPAEIVQARYDMVTPMRTAWALHRAWPEAGFRIVTLSNHTCSEPMLAELRAAMDRLGALSGL
ncbi:prolyl aminopeptidase [Arvimicrobium flavum]|uniref:prolyl aminopeptidase n=1 Tax=Arvimicrobium flavum TaxID=3393320 RepID=UPI00237AF2EA|nr:prolyl aminopeptidase [Mesorhizobium shangrilense]